MVLGKHHIYAKERLPYHFFCNRTHIGNIRIFNIILRKSIFTPSISSILYFYANSDHGIVFPIQKNIKTPLPRFTVRKEIFTENSLYILVKYKKFSKLFWKKKFKPKFYFLTLMNLSIPIPMNFFTRTPNPPLKFYQDSWFWRYLGS